MQLHSTSVGKALIAHLPPAEVGPMLQRRGLYKRTPQTITIVSRLMRDLEKVRELGYAIDDEENSPGVRCVAAPIFNSESGIEAALGLSGTTYQFDRASVPKIAELVKAASRKISHGLGASARRR